MESRRPISGEMGRFRKRRTLRSSGWLTGALAGAAALTAGTVLLSEALRIIRHHREHEADIPVLAEEVVEEAIDIARDGYEATPRAEVVLFNVLNGFIVSLGAMRLTTLGIRDGWWPRSNVVVGGRHIHHFVPGIGLAFAAGLLALLFEDRAERRLAFLFGAGMGMTFDEAALLLDLEDVYWSEEGLLSVQVSLGVVAILGATILGIRIIDRGRHAVRPKALQSGEDPSLLLSRRSDALPALPASGM